MLRLSSEMELELSISLLKNIFSARAQYGLSQATDALTRNFERLSSGSRINRPSDDSAGQAVAAGLSRDSRVYGRAILNLNDGVSALSIADASLGQLSDVTTRLKELATQSASGSLSRIQRNSLDDEADELVNEFNRLVATTRFNGVGLLDGSTQNMRLQAGYGTSGGIAFGLVDKLSRVTGSGSFSAGTTHTSGTGSQNDAVYADFDGDDLLDRISVGTTGRGMQFYKGNGDGSFGAGTTYNLGAQFFSVASGDFDGDGDLDLFVAASVNNSYVYTKEPLKNPWSGAPVGARSRIFQRLLVERESEWRVGA